MIPMKPISKPTGNTSAEPMRAGGANPADVWAVKQGFQPQIITDSSGNQSSVITLPGGRQVDSWSAYREAGSPSVNPVNKLVAINKGNNRRFGSDFLENVDNKTFMPSVRHSYLSPAPRESYTRAKNKITPYSQRGGV